MVHEDDAASRRLTVLHSVCMYCARRSPGQFGAIYCVQAWGLGCLCPPSSSRDSLHIALLLAHVPTASSPLPTPR